MYILSHSLHFKRIFQPILSPPRKTTELGAKDIKSCTIYTNICKGLPNSTSLEVLPLISLAIILSTHQVAIFITTQMLVWLVLLHLVDQIGFCIPFY